MTLFSEFRYDECVSLSPTKYRQKIDEIILLSRNISEEKRMKDIVSKTAAKPGLTNIKMMLCCVGIRTKTSPVNYPNLSKLLILNSSTNFEKGFLARQC